jgi:hypothetical protein
MPDELPIEVFTELGRVTWAAIKLEDYTKSMCATINPTDPRTDRRPISRQIKDANNALMSWPMSKVRDDAIAWLERAGLAIEERNAALHATPVVWMEGPYKGQLLLGEMPRANRLYTERPLTVDSLSALRFVLESASSGWVDVVVPVGTEWSRQARLRREATGASAPSVT